MLRILLMSALVYLTAPVAAAQAILGDWQGTLNGGGAQLHVVLHVAQAKDGALAASLDSVDQGVNGIPVTSIAFEHAKLTLRIESIHGTYEGTLNSAGIEIDGTWSQGAPMELDFKRVTAGDKQR